MQNKEEKLQRKAEYEFSIGLRLTHWVRAFAIVVLVITGYYLSYVFQNPISMVSQLISCKQNTEWCIKSSVLF